MPHQGNCHIEAINRVPDPKEYETLTDTLLFVWGMGCPNCAMRVRNALVSQDGVIDAQVDHFSGRALVRHNPNLVQPEGLLRLVESAGNDGHHRYSAALP
jgi:copper chaperone CopZ